MKVKTENLTGAALDWAVAKCEDEDYVLAPNQFELRHNQCWSGLFCYSSDWAQGGPIIDREGFCVGKIASNYWVAFSDANSYKDISGPTPLVAAMRCYVAIKLGDQVEVPDDLVKSVATTP